MKPLTRHAPPGLRHRARLAPLALGAVLGAGLVTGGCGQAAPSPGTATGAGASGTAVGAAEQTATAGGVRLEAAMAPTGAGVAPGPGLVVEYSLTNTGSKPVVAYDVVPDDLGSATLAPDVDPEHAWVYTESGVLRLSKQGFATAPNVRFAAAPVMGGHTIAPAATINGRAYAVTPPKLDVPGESFVAPRSPVDPAVDRWQLCIQVDDRAAQARPSTVGGGVVQAASRAPEGDELVCTAPAPIPVS